MPLLTPWRRHPWRWSALIAGAVIVALLIALGMYVHRLLQPQRFTSLLEHQLADVGIALQMQTPATPTLFPRPAVRIQRFSLVMFGSERPVLTARQATIVVPWTALLRRRTAIARIDIDAPQIDIGQLRTLLARLPHQHGPPSLPTITTGVHLRHGLITDDGTPLLFEASVTAGELAPGHRFDIDLAAHTADGRKISAYLDTVPSAPHDGSIDLQSIHIGIRRQGGISARLEGQGRWSGGAALALKLHGSLRYPRLVPRPALPGTVGPATGGTSAPPAVRVETVDTVALAVQPAAWDAPLTVALKLDGDGTHAAFHAQPTALGAWWQHLMSTPGTTSGPLPVTGSARVQNLDLGWLQATGVHIQAGPHLAPEPAVATSAAVASPAAAASAAAASPAAATSAAEASAAAATSAAGASPAAATSTAAASPGAH